MSRQQASFNTIYRNPSSGVGIGMYTLDVNNTTAGAIVVYVANKDASLDEAGHWITHESITASGHALVELPASKVFKVEQATGVPGTSEIWANFRLGSDGDITSA